eukprot:CAMPEP_0198144514 /NCGR_PEP_ID=MMETSP1443-20131203/16415_1 /TAXON_ID=186043 /ORGANISM="Entomoneis sp., Strain CCMP2396" /LENGTH=151 /DNA_ID=CAMNT_0043807921 /DNA_START=30 /DNA_END=482 /DNA_ORIENTATION=+
MSVRCGRRVEASSIVFYNPYVEFLPQAASAVVRSLLANPVVFRRYNYCVKVVFLEILWADEDALDNGRDAHDTAISAILEQEAPSLFSKRKKRTRSCVNSYLTLLERIHAMRKKRWLQEQHMGFTFMEDLHRTMIKLKFVAQALSLEKAEL